MAFDPITGYLMGQMLDVGAEKSGLKDRGRKILGGLMDMLVPSAEASVPNAENMPMNTGFVPAVEPQMPTVEPSMPTAGPTVELMTQLPVAQMMPPGGDFAGPVENAPMQQISGDFLPQQISSVDLTRPVNQEQAVQIAQEMRNAGMDTMQKAGVVLAVEGQKEPPPQDSEEQQQPQSGFLGRLKETLNNEESMLMISLALNSLRQNPDQGLATILGNRLSTIQKDRMETRKSNRTADVLLERGLITPDQAEMIRLGLAEQAFGTDKFSRILEMMKTPEGMAQLQQLKDLGALGGGTTVQIGGEQQTELDKMLGKKLGEKVSADFDAGTQARQALDSLDTLMGLSEGLDTATSIPPALRGLVPEGISDPLDAYRGVMTNVAKSLRIKGEGTMSDRDIDLLIRQAGPATSNLQARRIMQQTLKNKAQINLELSKLANQFMLGNMTREQYLEQVNVLNNTPAMNEEMRKYISALGGDQKPAGGQVKVISVE